MIVVNELAHAIPDSFVIVAVTDTGMTHTAAAWECDALDADIAGALARMIARAGTDSLTVHILRTRA